MTKFNKLYDTTPPVMMVKIGLRLSGLYHRFARFLITSYKIMSYALNKWNWYREAKENYPKVVLLVKILDRKIK